MRDKARTLTGWVILWAVTMVILTVVGVIDPSPALQATEAITAWLTQLDTTTTTVEGA